MGGVVCDLLICCILLFYGLRCFLLLYCVGVLWRDVCCGLLLVFGLVDWCLGLVNSVGTLIAWIMLVLLVFVFDLLCVVV